MVFSERKVRSEFGSCHGRLLGREGAPAPVVRISPMAPIASSSSLSRV